MVKNKKKRKGTKTSTFGTSKREGHDASLFYNRKLYQKNKKETKIDYIENKINKKYLNTIINADSVKLDFLPDSCIHLMITSPPYNTAKEYDDDLSLSEYLTLIKDVMKEVYRLLVPGGRACINVANIGRKPYIPLNSHISRIMENLDFLMRGEIIWEKAKGAGGSCAWGSWKSATNPTLRDVHEYIMIFSKKTYSRQIKKQNTITDKDFLRDTLSIWSFKPERAKKIGHPAPFPIELPSRLIQLYSFEGDVILDPFCGSGSTNIAAHGLRRNHIGIDNLKEYVKLAKMRLNKFIIDNKYKQSTIF